VGGYSRPNWHKDRGGEGNEAGVGVFFHFGKRFRLGSLETSGVLRAWPWLFIVAGLLRSSGLPYPIAFALINAMQVIDSMVIIFFKFSACKDWTF